MSLSPAARAILISGALILALSLGVRHAFGLFLQPLSLENGWGREVFGFALALQNLVWGLAQPAAGMLADRRGALPVVLGGAVLYAGGVAAMGLAEGGTAFVLTAGILVGLGLAGTTMPVVFGAISRAMPPEKRSLAFGVAMSVGSLGQFILLPAALGLIGGVGATATLLILGAISAAILPLAFALKGDRPQQAATPGPGTLEATRTAFGDRGFRLLSLGFFVCGFQVVFVGVHLPAFLADEGLAPHVGAVSLALIGLFNIFGSLGAGWLGGRYSKPRLLSFIYLGRGLGIALFILMPVTEISAYMFSVLMGLFWLSTVPLTNATVATMFGVRNMAYLGGIVFLAHQIGSFLGGWLGGLAFDRFGSYDIAWGIAIGLSLLAAIANWPIRDEAVAERTAAA